MLLPTEARGRAEVLEMIRHIDAAIEMIRFTPRRMIVDGEKAALRWQGWCRNRGTGGVTSVDGMVTVTVAEGAVTAVTDFLDTDRLVRLLAGDDPVLSAPPVAEVDPLTGVDTDPQAMLPRAEAVALLRQISADRISLGPAVVPRHFCDDGVLCFYGDSARIPFARQHHGREAVQTLIEAVDREIAYEAIYVTDVLVEGAHAALQWKTQSRHRGTGAIAWIDAMSHVVLRGDRVAAFIEFFDTEATRRQFDGEVDTAETSRLG
jgi:ketosteroid isomerase-like protein